jgi:hypothetical protein
VPDSGILGVNIGRLRELSMGSWMLKEKLNTLVARFPWREDNAMRSSRRVPFAGTRGRGRDYRCAVHLGMRGNEIRRLR